MLLHDRRSKVYNNLQLVAADVFVTIDGDLPPKAKRARVSENISHNKSKYL
jgi:hypothetical protein